MRYASGKTTNRDVKNETETPPERRRSQLGGRLWKAGMGLSLIVVGSVFVNYLWSSYQRAAVMDSWVETPCTIQSFTVDDSELNQRGMPKYVVEVRYLYEFEGEDYIGDRLKRLPTEASDPRKLADEIEDYPAGTETVCHVNPDSPDEAVLEKDTKAALYTIWFPCLFVVGGAGMILSALFGRRGGKTRDADT